jgi:hypothetical protein
MGRKLGAVAAMAGIVLFLAASDFYLVTRSATLSRIARQEIEKRLGPLLEAADVRASLDGRVTLEEPRIRLGGPGFPLQKASRIEILFGDLLHGRIRRLTVEGMRLALSQRLFEELHQGEGKRSIQDLFPDPEDLPQIVVLGGTVEVELPGVFPGGPQPILLREWTLTPTRGYRAYLEGIFENPVYGRWRTTGEVDLSGGPSQVRLESSFLVIDPRMRLPLAPKLREIYDKYLPGGTCNLVVDVGGERDRALDFTVTLQALNMQLNYKFFPYQADQVSGEIVFYEKGFRIKHMKARHGGATIRFDGAAGGYPEDSPYKFRIEIDDALLDQELRSALPKEESRQAWDRFSPSGRVNVRGLVEREAGPDKPAHIPLEISVPSASLRFREVPYDISNVSGDLVIDGDDVAIKRLVARDGDSVMQVAGSIHDLTADASLDLSIEAEALPLDERLRKSLPEGARKIWDELSPTGSLDGRVRLSKEKGKDVRYEATLRPRKNSIRPAAVPIPVADLEGEIQVIPGEIRLRHLTGKTRGAHLGVRGLVAGETVELDLDATGLTIDDALVGALPAEARDLLRELKLSGGVGFMAGYRSGPGGKKEFTVDLKISKGMLDIDPRIEDLEGHLALEGFVDREVLLRGPIAVSSVLVAGKRLTDVGASLNVKGSKVNLVNIKATAYGGLLAGKSFSVDTKSGEFYSEGITVDRLDLHEYSLDTQGYAKKTLGGRASLTVQDLSGRAADLKAITGKGRLTIRDGLLWDIPVFVSLFTLNPQELFKPKQQFDTGAVDFELKDRKFVIERLSFSSESVSVLGKGTVDFDGNLNLVLKTKTGFFGIDFLPINLVTGLFDELKGAFHGVAVTGTFEKPETSQKFFPGIGK